jgi:hypothetical protein
VPGAVAFGRVARVALVVLAFAPSGCAAHLPPCPASGGPAWREVESRHFRLRTDEDAGTARDTLRELEQLQAALLTVWRAPPDLDGGRVPVVLVGQGWIDFADREVEGMFARALFQPLILMRAGSPVARQELIKHELVHYLSRLAMPAQPPWLSEGLATYFQTIEVDAEQGRLTVGRPPAELLRVVQAGGILRIEEMMAAREIRSERALFYSTAWLTVHYLMNRHAAQLVAYEVELARRTPPTEAWTRAFGELTPSALEWEIRAYVDGGSYDLLVYPFAAPSGDATGERALADEDVHATRALLFMVGARDSARNAERSDAGEAWRASAGREVDEALRLDPAHLLGQAVAHWGLRRDVDLGRARLAVEKHAGEWMAWALLVEALRASRAAESQQEEAARHMLELAHADPSVELGIRRVNVPHGSTAAPK